MRPHRLRTIAYPLAAVLVGSAVAGSGPAHAAVPYYSSEAHTALSLSPDGTSDLDGDGLGEVIAQVSAPGPRIEVRRGVDGALLWTRSGSPGVFQVMRVGAPSRPGLVISSLAAPGK